MFATKESAKDWLHSNAEYIRYNDPTPWVEELLVEELFNSMPDGERQATRIMQKYLLPF